MNLFKLSWKNITAKPWSTALNLILFSFGVSIISLLLILNDQLENTLEKNQAGIGLVVGAKGSPLQLILSSIYHVDVPTGNIKLAEAQKLARNPLISKGIPLALGDSYKGFRIVGTDHEYPALYETKVAAGNLWEHDLEVTIGAKIAQQFKLKVGDEFFGAHGMGEGGGHHDHHPFVVKGIFEPSGTVIDQLILTNVASVWKVHEHGDEDKKGKYKVTLGKEDHHEEEEHDKEHANHEEGQHHDDEHAEHDEHHEEDREITAMLLKFRSPMGAITLPRMINANTNMQAASPAYETARLFSLIGVGADALKALAAIIIIISGLSVFISLYNSMKERRYEIAYLRVLGATRLNLFMLIILEGIIIAVLGYLIGIGMSHFGMSILGSYLEDSWKFSFAAWQLQSEEIALLWGALAIGFVSAIIPAWQAYKTDISSTLSNQ
ncbi:FtsX-like permease family protein [Limibacter armeniacum]|uniref:ABC transporter permease n=1 Tax=Limibacter armeniacum TaxID=466084 RepID=UPI002FE575E4